MVAEAEAVGDLSIEERHRLGGYFPLVVVIGLGDVALMKEKGYIERADVVANPACLAEKIPTQVAPPISWRTGRGGCRNSTACRAARPG